MASNDKEFMEYERDMKVPKYLGVRKRGVHNMTTSFVRTVGYLL